jgi:hypothetical protein
MRAVLVSVYVQRRLREFFHQRKHVRVAERAFSVTRKMSTRLQAEVITLVYGTWLRKITFLNGCETPCVMAVALAFKPVTFAPTESPKLRHLYVIMRGLVTYGLRCAKSCSAACTQHDRCDPSRSCGRASAQGVQKGPVLGAGADHSVIGRAVSAALPHVR